MRHSPVGASSTASPRRSRPARRLGVLAIALVVTFVLGCTSGPPPTRSPFDDRGAVPTVPRGVPAYPPPFAPPSMTPAPGSSGAPSATVPTSPAAGDPEAAAGAAIEALANRMAVNATRLSLVRVEAVDWPNGCLGVELPGMTCTQVVTPGYRVTLRYDTTSMHEMRTGRGGASAWVAQTTVRATVREAERASTALAITDASGKALAVLLAPGTQRLGVPPGSLKAGDRIVLGVDDVRDGGPLRAVWLARE